MSKPRDEEHQSKVDEAECSTLQTSQDDQAYGYLESLAEDAFIDELQSALENAGRLTKKSWKLIITAGRVEIRPEGDKRIKLPKPGA